MGFEEGFKMGSDLIDKIGSRRESRSKSDYYDALAEKNRGSAEKAAEAVRGGSRKLRAGKAIQQREGESEEEYKARKRAYKTENPYAGTDIKSYKADASKQALENKKIKEAARMARMQNDEFEKVAHLKSDTQRAREIEAGVRQKEVTVKSTQATTGKTIADTEYQEKKNEVFAEQHKADLANDATNASANMMSAMAQMSRAQTDSYKATNVSEEMKVTTAAATAVGTYIGNARQLLEDPKSKALPSKIFSDGEEMLRKMPIETLPQQKAAQEARVAWEQFREDADTSSRYAQSRARQTDHAIGFSGLSDAQVTQYNNLIKQGRHREAAEMVGMRAFTKYLIKNEVPVRVLIEPSESKQFLKYDQDPDNKWHTIETTMPDGTIKKDYVKDKDGAPIPNMVLNVEDSRDLLEQYIDNYRNKFEVALRGTKSVSVGPARGSTGVNLGDLGGQPADGGDGKLDATDRVTVSNLGPGQLEGMTSSDGHPNLHQRLLAARTPEDIDDMMKAITDPQADLWALFGDDSGKFRTEGIKAMGEQGTLSPEEQATALKNQQEFEEKKAAVLREALRRQEERNAEAKAPEPTEPKPTEPKPKESGEMVDPKRGEGYTLKPDGTKLYMSDVDRVAKDKYHVSKDLFWNERVGEAGYDPIATAATKDFMGKGEYGKMSDAVEAQLEPFKQTMGLGNKVDLVGLAKKLNRQKGFAGVKPERWPDKIQYPVLRQVKAHGDINSAWKKAGLKVGTWVPQSSRWTKPLTRKDRQELHRLMLPVTKRIIELEAANRRTGKE